MNRMANINKSPDLPTFIFGAGAIHLPNATESAANFSFNFGSEMITPTFSADSDYDELEDEGEEKEVAITSEVVALRELQVEYDGIMEKLAKEQRALLRDYEEKVKKLADKRRDVISGAIKVPCKACEDGVVASEGKGIKSFWLNCLVQSQFDDLIMERDSEALESITDLTTELLPEGGKNGFMVTFHFAENKYFTNEKLSLTVLVNAFPVGEDIQGVESTEIDWKEGHDLTKLTNHAGEEIDTPTFFKIFDQVRVPEELKDVDLADLDEVTLSDVMAAMQMRDFVATSCFILREKVIPKAVDWYTGDAEMDGDFLEDDCEPECGKGCC